MRADVVELLEQARELTLKQKIDGSEYGKDYDANQCFQEIVEAIDKAMDAADYYLD